MECSIAAPTESTHAINQTKVDRFRATACSLVTVSSGKPNTSAAVARWYLFLPRMRSASLCHARDAPYAQFNLRVVRRDNHIILWRNNAWRIRRPSSLRTGMFCRLGRLTINVPLQLLPGDKRYAHAGFRVDHQRQLVGVSRFQLRRPRYSRITFGNG